MRAPRSSIGWTDVVVVCGARRWDGHRPSVHHLAAALGRHIPVLYVDPVRPVDRSRAEDEPDPLQLIGPALAELSPRVPAVGPWMGAGSINTAFGRRAVRQALAELGSPRVRAMIVSSFDPWFGACDEELRVFYAADDFLSGSALARRSPQRIERNLHRSLSTVDLVVAASPVLGDVFRSQGVEVVVLPNGCDVVEVDDDDPRRARRGRAAGFVGELSNQVDVEVLDAVADRGHDVLIVGRGPVGPLAADLRTLLSRSNVEWVGPRSPDAIGPYLGRIDVGLAPFVDTPYERACLPLDLLGHLTVGRPVVGTDCEVVRWLRSSADAGLLDLDDDLAIGATPGQVADLVGAQLARPRDPLAVDRRRSFARGHRWSARCTDLADRLGLGGPAEPAPCTEEVS